MWTSVSSIPARAWSITPCCSPRSRDTPWPTLHPKMAFPPPMQRKTCQDAQPWSKSLSGTCTIKDMSPSSIKSTYNEFGHKLAWPNPSVSSTTHLRRHAIALRYVVLGFAHFALVVPLLVTWLCKCFHHCPKCCRSSQLGFCWMQTLINQWDWAVFPVLRFTCKI